MVGITVNVPANSIPNKTNASHNTGSSFSSAKDLKTLKELEEEQREALLKKYYLSEEEICQKVEEIKRSEVSSQKEYYINLFKGKNDSACQKLESAYAQACINSQMEHLVKFCNMNRDYIDRIMQDEEVLIKLYTADNRADISLSLCKSINQKKKLPYAICSIGTGQFIESSVNYEMARKNYILYIKDQFFKKIPADQVMTFSKWKELNEPALVLS